MQLILFFIIGTIGGSFATLVIQRTQINESIILPRSHCDHCKTQLKSIDLIPIISYLTLLGKCRYCHQRINPLIVISELLWGGLFSMQIIFELHLLLFTSLIILTVLSVIDIEKLMVPTVLIIIGGVNNLAYYFWFNNGSIIQLLAAVIIYPLILKINQRYIHIGDGDIDIIFMMWLVVGIHHLLALIIIASILALIYLLINHHQKKVAFIPFLTIAYLICILIHM